MRYFLISLLCLSFLSLPSFSEMPYLSVPLSMEVLGNGLNCVAFVVKIENMPEEIEKNFNFTLKGLPVEAPGMFDKTSRLFFWRPEPKQAGRYKFDFVAEDGSGLRYSRSVRIRVLEAPTLEALPKGWKDKKKEDKYLIGRNYFPSSNFIEMDIAALPDYEVEIKVKNSMDEDCTLNYLPEDGLAEVNRTQKTAVIKLGGQYASDKLKKIRRDLYEDLFNTLGLVFKRIESIKVKGEYQLENFWVYDKKSLIAAAAAEDLYLPELNLSFDDSFYQETLYSRENPMMIADAPVIKVDFNVPSGLAWRRSRLLVDKTEYHANRGDFTLVVVKPSRDVSSFDMDYAMYMLRIPAAKKLPFGEHVFVFEAENAYGMLMTREAYARVVTLPTQVIGKPMTYPSPFSPIRHGEVKIQYNLSIQTNIELVIFNVAGTTIMRRRISMGEEGARKGYNTVTWDGKSDAGYTLPNGIYTGVIIDRNENRILERFLITVYQ